MTQNKDVYNKVLDEQVIFEGRLFEVVRQTIEYKNTDKAGTFKIEIARRAPGVRAIIIKEDKILLTKEFRLEHNSWDYRLPGGKVFDKLIDYKNCTSESNELSYAIEAVKKELKEEVGLISDNPKFLSKTKAGSSIKWDLYYFEVRDFTWSEHGQDLEDGELINVQWKNISEVPELYKEGLIHEDRSAGVLLKYLYNNGIL